MSRSRMASTSPHRSARSLAERNRVSLQFFFGPTTIAELDGACRFTDVIASAFSVSCPAYSDSHVVLDTAFESGSVTARDEVSEVADIAFSRREQSARAPLDPDRPRIGVLLTVGLCRCAFGTASPSRFAKSLAGVARSASRGIPTHPRRRSRATPTGDVESVARPGTRRVLNGGICSADERERRWRQRRAPHAVESEPERRHLQPRAQLYRSMYGPD